MIQTTIMFVVTAIFSVSQITGGLPFDRDFVTSAHRFAIKESFFKRAMVFTDAETGVKTRCKYGFSWVRSSGTNVLKKDVSKKTKATQKVFNGFNHTSYKVKAVTNMEKVDIVLGETTRSDTRLLVVHPETGKQLGFFDVNVGAQAILTGQIKQKPVLIKEHVLWEERRLPLFETRYFPAPTTGFFTISGKDGLLACLVIHPSPRKEGGYSLYLNHRLTPEERADTITLVLLFPIFRSIGS